MSITKYRSFCKTDDLKTQFQFFTESISDLPICKLGDTEAAFGTSTGELGQTESQFGGTETARVSQRIELGHTDLQFLVRPKMHVHWPKPKSVRPISTTQSVRDEFGGDLTPNFQLKTNLRDVFAGQDDFNRGKDHGKAMC